MKCSCLFCGLDMLSTDENHVSTYCGSICVDCCKYHAAECGVCRDDFVDRELVDSDDLYPTAPTSLYQVSGVLLRNVTDGLGISRQERIELPVFYMDAKAYGLETEAKAKKVAEQMLARELEYESETVALLVTQL